MRLLLWAALAQCAAALRTGVAPHYIPTMRQISSYETSNIDTKIDAVMELRARELEQIQCLVPTSRRTAGPQD